MNMVIKHVYFGLAYLFMEVWGWPDFLSIKKMRADHSEAVQVPLFQAISPFIHSVCLSASSFIHSLIHIHFGTDFKESRLQGEGECSSVGGESI